MVVRAYKHVLHAVVAAVDNIGDLALSIASCLNVLLGTASEGNADSEITNDDNLKWKWVETFLFKRFGWKWKDENIHDLRKFAILRGLCHKVCSCLNLRLHGRPELHNLLLLCKRCHLCSGWTGACFQGL